EVVICSHWTAENAYRAGHSGGGGVRQGWSVQVWSGHVQNSTGMTPERYQRLMTLFQAACQRGTAESAAYLQEACAGDDVLRREVEELLAAEKKSRGLLEHSPGPSVFAAGTAIGSYRIESKLGEGGMGMVFRAL